MKRQCILCSHYSSERDMCERHNPEAYIEKYTCDDFESKRKRSEIDAMRRRLDRVSGLAEQLRRAVNDGILAESEGMPAIASLCRTQAELGIRIEELAGNDQSNG